MLESEWLLSIACPIAIESFDSYNFLLSPHDLLILGVNFILFPIVLDNPHIALRHTIEVLSFSNTFAAVDTFSFGPFSHIDFT